MIKGIEKKFDKYLATFGILVGFIAIFLSIRFHLNREYLGVAIIMGASLYLSGRDGIRKIQIASYRTPRYVVWLMIVLFFIFLFFSETIVRNSLYSRSFGYILLVLGAVIICVIQIELFVGQANLHWVETAILLEICLLSISVKSGAFFMYPSVSGNDPFLHERIIQEILTKGIIPVSSYKFLPLIHLVSASIGLLTEFAPKFGLFYISIVQSFVSAGVYFIGKGLANAKTGLCAVLLLSLSDYAIQWGVQIIPMTIGAIIFTLIFIGIFQRAYTQDRRDKLSWTIVLITLCASLIVTHTLASLIVLVMLGILALGTTLYNLVSRSKDWVEWSLTILFCIGLFTYWMNAFSNPELDFFSMMIKSIKFALTTAEVGDVSSVSLAQEFSFTSLLLSEIGWSLLLIFTVAGAIESFTKHVRQPAGIFTALITGLFLAVTYGGAIVGAEAILPARWIIFLYLPSSVLAAYYLSKIVVSRNWIIKLCGLFFVTAISFFMITQPSRAMPDSPLYSAEFGYRPGFFSSEIKGFDFVQQNFDPSCKVAASSKSDLYLYQAGQLDPRKPETYQTANIIVLRLFDFEKGIFVPYEPNKVFLYVPLTPDFINYLSSPHLFKKYDNGTVDIYTTQDCGIK